MKWKGKIINWLIEQLKDQNDWNNLYGKLTDGDTLVGVHLAIFTEPYLTLVLDGLKTMESRFSTRNVSPFGKVSVGDFILLKKAGGPIVAGFLVDSVKYFSGLNLRKMMQIDSEYGAQICTKADPRFWEARIDAKYATLIKVGKIKHFEQFETSKSDRTAWTVIRRQGVSLFDIYDQN